MLRSTGGSKVFNHGTQMINGNGNNNNNNNNNNN